MNRFVSAMLAMLMAAFVPAHADDPTEEEAAQLTGQCGEIKNRNTSSQFGSGVWLEYIAETVRPVNTFECPWLSVSVEVYVVGVHGSAHAATGMFVATSRRQIPVPSPGEWQTNSNHYRNYLWLFSFNAGTMSSKAEVTAAAEQVPSFEEAEEDENFCGGDSDTPCVASGPNEPDSPIIIDVDRNGYHLTSLEDGVFFDLDADGALDFVAWTHPSSEDAFLALDRNGNGRIDNGAELFGNHTPAYATRSSITASNGFEALKFLESPSVRTGGAERGRQREGRRVCPAAALDGPQSQRPLRTRRAAAAV